MSRHFLDQGPPGCQYHLLLRVLANTGNVVVGEREFHNMQVLLQSSKEMLEESMKKQIDLWLKHGVVLPSNSPWNFNLLAAVKKGMKIRWW